MGFKEDLKVGQKVEEEIVNIIRNKYPMAIVVEGYNKGYDIMVPEIPCKIEVKYDIMSHMTGNFFIESNYDGKPSGIITTESKWWVQVDKEDIMWILSDTLNYLIREWELKEILFSGSHKSSPKKGYLIPKEKLYATPYPIIFEREKCKNSPIQKENQK